MSDSLPQGVGSVQGALAVCLCVSLSLGRGGVEVSAHLGQKRSFIFAFHCALLSPNPLGGGCKRLKKFAGGL